MKKGSGSVTAFIIIVLVVAAIGLGIYFAKNKTKDEAAGNTNNENGQIAGANTTADEREIISTPNADTIIFYGSTCPHCKKVNDFIIQNDIDKKLQFQHLEVYENKNNQNLMAEKLNKCTDLSEDDKGGVPFLYSPDKCVVGDQPIIEYLKEKAGI